MRDPAADSFGIEDTRLYQRRALHWGANAQLAVRNTPLSTKPFALSYFACRNEARASEARFLFLSFQDEIKASISWSRKTNCRVHTFEPRLRMKQEL